MDELILGDLTADEAQEFVKMTARLHPVLSLRVRVCDRPATRTSVSLAHEIVTDADEAESYRDVLEALVRKLLPIRLRVLRDEEAMAGLVSAAIASGSTEEPGAKEAIRELCNRLEYRIVPYLLPFGDFVDGFDATSTVFEERSITLAGRCWFLPDSIDGGPFQARFELDGSGVLRGFELRFGDPAIVAASRLLPRDLPDVVHDELFGYRSTIRRAPAPSDEDAQFTFFLVRK